MFYITKKSKNKNIIQLRQNEFQSKLDIWETTKYYGIRQGEQCKYRYRQKYDDIYFELPISSI